MPHMDVFIGEMMHLRFAIKDPRKTGGRRWWDWQSVTMEAGEGLRGASSKIPRLAHDPVFA